MLDKLMWMHGVVELDQLLEKALVWSYGPGCFHPKNANISVIGTINKIYVICNCWFKSGSDISSLKRQDPEKDQTSVVNQDP